MNLNKSTLKILIIKNILKNKIKTQWIMLLYKYKKELKSICTRMMFPFKKIFNKKLFVTFELDFYTTLSFRRTRVVF